jgi:hypothetical protein
MQVMGSRQFDLRNREGPLEIFLRNTGDPWTLGF